MKMDPKKLPLNQETLKSLDGILFNTGEIESSCKNVLNILSNHGYPKNVKTVLDLKLLCHISLASYEDTFQSLIDIRGDDPVNYDEWEKELPGAEKIMSELPDRFKEGAEITLNERFIRAVDEAFSVVSDKKRTTEPAVSSRDYWLKGYAFEDLGMWENALSSYNKAIELGKGQNECLAHKARVLAELNRKDEAIHIYNEELTQTNNLERLILANHGLACLYIEQKDYLSASKYFLSINSNLKAILQVGKMDRKGIDNIRFKDGEKINTYCLFYLIIRIISELEEVPKNQCWQDLKLKETVISAVDETFLGLSKWIEETRQTEV